MIQTYHTIETGKLLVPNSLELAYARLEAFLARCERPSSADDGLLDKFLDLYKRHISDLTQQGHTFPLTSDQAMHIGILYRDTEEVEVFIPTMQGEIPEPAFNLDQAGRPRFLLGCNAQHDHLVWEQWKAHGVLLMELDEMLFHDIRHFYQIVEYPTTAAVSLQAYRASWETETGRKYQIPYDKKFHVQGESDAFLFCPEQGWQYRIQIAEEYASSPKLSNKKGFLKVVEILGGNAVSAWSENQILSAINIIRNEDLVDAYGAAVSDGKNIATFRNVPVSGISPSQMLPIAAGICDSYAMQVYRIQHIFEGKGYSLEEARMLLSYILNGALIAFEYNFGIEDLVSACYNPIVLEGSVSQQFIQATTPFGSVYRDAFAETKFDLPPPLPIPTWLCLEHYRDFERDRPAEDCVCTYQVSYAERPLQLKGL